MRAPAVEITERIGGKISKLHGGLLIVLGLVRALKNSLTREYGPTLTPGGSTFSPPAKNKVKTNVTQARKADPSFVEQSQPPNFVINQIIL